MKSLFLACALCLPLANFTNWHAAKNEQDQLRDELKKHPGIKDVFITPKGQTDKLRENGWERAPFSIDGQEIWIQRKPKSDRRITTSA